MNRVPEQKRFAPHLVLQVVLDVDSVAEKPEQESRHAGEVEDQASDFPRCGMPLIANRTVLDLVVLDGGTLAL
jgi:hypothetical protein